MWFKKKRLSNELKQSLKNKILMKKDHRTSFPENRSAECGK